MTEPISYTSQILRPQSQLYQPQSSISPSKQLNSPSKYSRYTPSRKIASPRQVASPSRQIASPSRQIASPSRLVASPSRYQESRVISQSGCPSIYSPTKSRVQQSGVQQSSYFVQNVPEMNSYVPDYATYLTQSPRGSKHIEQPLQDPPVFVAQQPAQSSLTPGEPVRFDHYQTVGDAPSRIMPSGSPDRTIKARLLQPKSYQQQQQYY